jgi:hypothetical protein
MRHFRSARRVYSGFAIDVDFATAEEAARAFPALCVFGQAPGQNMVAPDRANVRCAAGT